MVSVWARLKEPEDGVDLLKDLCDVRYYDVDFQDLVADEAWSMQPIKRLLDQVSYSSSFADAAVAAAPEKKLPRARQVLCQFDFRYDPARGKGTVASDPVFIGAIKWDDNRDEL